MRCPLLLDANAIISLFDGSDPELERALCGAEELVVPVVAYAEVVAGTESDTAFPNVSELLILTIASGMTAV